MHIFVYKITNLYLIIFFLLHIVSKALTYLKIANFLYIIFYVLVILYKDYNRKTITKTIYNKKYVNKYFKNKIFLYLCFYEKK